MADGMGARVRMIRRRRGLSLSVAAGLAGISSSYLSRLENGERDFNRRGLVEKLAEAFGCSPLDLTGGPIIRPDRRSLVAASAIPGLTAALHDTTIDDAPDIPTRPVETLVDLADRANAAADEVNYDLVSGTGLGDLITELHVVALNGKPDERRTALTALVSACIVARSLAGTLGHGELAVTATRRGWDAARMVERPDLAGLMAMGRVVSLNRIGARHRASTVLHGELASITQLPGPSREDTSNAEATGMLHLSAAYLAAREGDVSTADTHLDEAEALAAFTGERNFMRYHFGPANVGAWRLAVAVETDRGPEEAERLAASPLDLAALGSADRRAAVHFDLARAWAQDRGHDDHALRHLDEADRIAPIRVRQDPIARELVVGVDRRSKKRQWELHSLKNRLGVA
jgi:transcriptional regulator with XRE-family HTH domain